MNLIQGSPEWHLFRRSHIGASDVPAIMGTCNFRTPKDVFDAKLGADQKDISGEWHIIRGHSLEPVTLARFEMLHGCSLTNPTQEYKAWPRLHASLDGLWVEKNIIVECKAPAFWKHNQALCGLVPDTYVDQIQAQLLVFESDLTYYCSLHDDYPEGMDYAEVAVGRDEKRMKEILETCERFWSCVEKGIWDDSF